VQILEVFCEVKGLRRRGYRRTYSETVSRRNTHRGACCESNARERNAPEYRSMFRKDAI